MTSRSGRAARFPAHRAALAAISLAPEHGGVAYVGRLLREALRASFGEPWTLTLDPRQPDRVAGTEAARFSARLLLANARGRFDFVVFNHPGIARAQFRVPRVVRKPYVVQLHGTDVFDAALPRSHTEALRGAALRLAPSRFTAERGAEVNPGIGPITVCPHGLLPAGPPAGRPDAALLGRVRRSSALIVGRLWASERRKGHDQLLEAWPAIMRRVPDAQLVIAGDGDDRARLQAKAHALGVAADVLFCGYVSDATLAALREACGVFAMPSRQEGFGLVYAEAMRDGMPCLGSTRDAAEDIIEHGTTGFLVEQSDTASLADSLAQLLGSEELRRRFGAAGRRRFEAEFTFERYRERLTRLLVESLEGGGEPASRGRESWPVFEPIAP